MHPAVRIDLGGFCLKINGKIIVITGASSGIGRECSLLLCSLGARVFALSRSGLNEQGVTDLTCDVTDEQSVRIAFESIINQAGRIDALVCCAGSGIAGAVEDTDKDEMEGLMQVNYFGAVSCARAVLPQMRKQKSGTIVFISSVAAIFGIPFQGFYSASKYALEGTAEALACEVAPYGISVCTVLPGDTKTGFTANRKYTKRTVQGTCYKQEFCSAINTMTKDEINGAPPIKVAKCVLRAVKRKNPPPKIIVGAGYKTLALLRRLLPDRLVRTVLRLLYCKGKQESEYWSFERDVK